MPNHRARIQSLLTHPAVRMLGSIALLMVLYSVCRLVFYWLNIHQFTYLTMHRLGQLMLAGMRFDLSAILYLSMLYILLQVVPLPWTWRTHPTYQRVAKWVLWVPNILGLFGNMVDCIYSRFTGRRTTLAFFTEFQHDDNLLWILLQSTAQYWYVALIFLALAAILVWLTHFTPTYDSAPRSGWLYYLVESLVLLTVGYLTILGMRGGPGSYTRPINISNAMQYVERPNESLIVLNTPFSVMRSSSAGRYMPVHYYTDEEMEQRMSPLRQPTPAAQPLPPNTNVVILLLESFSKNYIGFYQPYDSTVRMGFTPFLDSIFSEGLTYTHAFANGRKSIDALPSVLSSIPMLRCSFAATDYATNTISSLPYCLREWGYTASFFHGAPNGSMGFQAFLNNAGVKQYFGETEYNQSGYPAAFDGTWAIWDEEFLDFSVHTLDTLREPFITTIFTASSHHPFRVPKRYEGVFPNKGLPIHTCVGYTDHALRQFFRYAQQQPWFEHTLFVITADHTSHPSEVREVTELGLFQIPICFYYPSCIAPEVDTTTVISQVDIMPTILSMMGYSKPFFAFGENAYQTTKRHNYAISYNADAYQLASDSLFLQFDGERVINVYDYVRDPWLLQPIDVNHPDYQQRVQDMTDYLKAYIQQYIQRMITNQLTYGKDR